MTHGATADSKHAKNARATRARDAARAPAKHHPTGRVVKVCCEIGSLPAPSWHVAWAWAPAGARHSSGSAGSSSAVICSAFGGISLDQRAATSSAQASIHPANHPSASLAESLKTGAR